MKKEFFERYQIINNNSFISSKDDSISRFDNKNSIYFYFVQRNLRDGKKLKCLNQLFLSLKLLKYFSLYFLNKYNNLSRFQNGFHHNFAVARQYKSVLPTFTLRLQNEYKGKHKTKRKFMYPLLLEWEKSQFFELSLWLKRIALKYKYRHYSTRLSVILFNFFFYFNTKYDKISGLNKKIYTKQRGLKRLFIVDSAKKVDSKYITNYKKLLWKSTLKRLNTHYLNRVNHYYFNLLSVNKDKIDYITTHSLNREELMKKMKVLKLKKK